MNREYQLPVGTRIPAGTRIPVFVARTLPVKRVGPVRVYPPGTRVIEIRVLPLLLGFVKVSLLNFRELYSRTRALFLLLLALWAFGWNSGEASQLTGFN